MPQRRGGDDRWKGLPVQAGLVRLATFAVPVAASVAVAAGISRLLTPAADPGGLALRVVAVLVPATLTLLAVDRLARRFLPLATLLRLSLVFPDRAPSRYAVARLVRSTQELQRRVEAARAGRIPEEPGEAARTILALVAALSDHDRRTRGHSERVRIYTDLLAEEVGLPAGERDRLRWAALVHDIGKLHVPERILNKAGRPTDDEWAILRRHPEEGARLCGSLLPWLGDAGRAVVEHHERFDGTGYPAGLAGEAISLGGRILAVADAFEVMTAARAYKRAMDAEAARAELARCAGTQFDPAVVRAFLSISLGRLRLAMGPLSWLAQWPLLSHLPQFGQSAGQAGAALGSAATLGAMGMLTPAGLPAPAAPPPAQEAVTTGHAEATEPEPLAAPADSRRRTLPAASAEETPPPDREAHGQGDVDARPSAKPTDDAAAPAATQARPDLTASPERTRTPAPDSQPRDPATRPPVEEPREQPGREPGGEPGQEPGDGARDTDDLVDEAVRVVGGTVEDAVTTVEDTVEDTVTTVEGTVTTVEDTLEDTVTTVEEAVGEAGELIEGLTRRLRP